MAHFQSNCRSFFHTLTIFFLYTLSIGCYVNAYPRIYGQPDINLIPRSFSNLDDGHGVCKPADVPFNDYSAKERVPEDAPICPLPPAHLLLPRDEDFSCSETKPCSNGACCPKKTGFCNYGPEFCGTNGQSPNDVCWSNCDAHAECGINAKVPGTKCPLNVCCSQFGFCGMTDDFCKKGPDSTTGCQSNCDQPGSGGSGGDVQSRVIGYYEAWAHDRACTGMNFDQIPVSGLTHLYFSFGYISPGDFNVAPMDDLSITLFNDMTKLKARNADLKCIVALGGWTFNDNGTATQPVFSDMVSSPANRQKFIQNLFSFLREYAFDGVDFDWEYPGAPDRGGRPEDGANFAQFLKELRDAISQQPIQYIVSFTVPTSYWYLRGFDLKATEYADFVNVMSYDLHGTWDANNPIGNHVLAHTNLTEIKQALDLLWRNSVDPKKINLGLGFYGRSFQLSDPTCWQPGCLFLGGASPGACTENSGTLSYREITQIIDSNKLTPYYDRTNAVKYIVWNKDQWVSYDDAETFKQKIDFANNLGLGGLLIWSIDQDTQDLKALSAVLAPKPLNVFAAKSGDQSYWKDGTAQDCYVTGCGGTCNPGFVSVTKQPCGGATPVTRHSKEADSTLCCPLESAPDTSKCTWRGEASECNGQCHPGEVTMQLNRWGSGKYCEHGNKVYCCEVPEAKFTGCHWTGAGGRCNSGEDPLTFAGTFLSTIADVAAIFGGLVGQALASALDQYEMENRRLFCCPTQEISKWKNCAWHGQPGSCDDDHCDIGHQVQLATDAYGFGQSCAPRFERQRVFCCDPAKDGTPLFPPVALDHLFPNPPTGNNVDTDFDLDLDNTWGTGSPQTSSSDPNDASFAFVILTSPEELQISLDKRDSPWELYGCTDPVSEEQTVKMICSDDSETDNAGCGKIHLGHGARGTIVEMPQGCGPGKYAVVKSMEPSKDQRRPKHLVKRFPHMPTVYDLTFNYDFSLVPRDLGDTQMRIDFSNEAGYWDQVVEAAAKKRKVKRSLNEYGRDHKRWLEDEWRDDMHYGSLSKEELHKRWFGSDVIAWLKKLLSTGVNPSHTHNLDESFTAILVREEFQCPIGGVEVRANLLAQAQARVQVSTTFGLTIIATLGKPLNLRNSFMYFANKGNVQAIFTLDALAQVKYSSGDKELFKVPIPGASFYVPGIVRVGPEFSLVGLLEASVTFAGHMESKVQLASWNVRQTFPDQGSDYNPTQMGGAPDHAGTDKIGQPTFDFSVSAKGDITAHLKPTFSFGIKFDSFWSVDPCQVQLVADGYVRLYAEAQKSTSNPNCPFTYGVDVGADLYAHVDAPSVFGWNLGVDRFNIAQVPAVQVVRGGSCPAEQSRPQRRALTIGSSDPMSDSTLSDLIPRTNAASLVSLGKRSQTYGPIFSLNVQERFCPRNGNNVKGKCNFARGFSDSDLDRSDSSAKRDLLGIEPRSEEDGNSTDHNEIEDQLIQTHHWDKRKPKQIDYCVNNFGNTAISPDYYPSGEQMKKFPNTPVYGPQNADDCTNMNFVQKGQPPDTSIYSTEHILEFQMFPKFLDWMGARPNTWPNPLDTSANARQVSFCEYYWIWYQNTNVNLPVNTQPVSGTGTPHSALMLQFPSKTDFTGDWMLLIQTVNGVKERMWEGKALRADDIMENFLQIGTQDDVMDACAVVKTVAWALQYHVIADNILTNQVLRIRNFLNNLDTQWLPAAGQGGGNKRAYQQIGIGALWQSWMHDRAVLAKNRAVNFLNEYWGAIEQGYEEVKDDPTAGFPDNFPETFDNLKALVAQVTANGGVWNPGF